MIEELVRAMVGDIATDATTAVTLKVVAVFVSLAASLFHQHNFGPQLPSQLVEQLVARFEGLYTAQSGKLCSNVVQALGYCYQFELVGHALIVDLCKRLIVSFGTLDVELLLAVRNLPASFHPMLIWPKNIARFR